MNKQLTEPLHCEACQNEHRSIQFVVLPDKAGLTLSQAQQVIQRHYNDAHRKMGQ